MTSERGQGTCHLVSSRIIYNVYDPWLVPIVTRTFDGGATESETGVGSLSSDFTRHRPTLTNRKCIKIVVCSGCGNSLML